MLERILWFYQELKRNAFPSKKRYVERLEVHPSTFKRDIDVFRDRLGAPLEYDRTRNGYYLSDAAFEIPSFWFNRAHLLMMAGICRQLDFLGPDAPEEIGKLRQKLQDLLTLRDGGGVLDLVSFENVEWYRFDNHCFDIILEAMLGRRCLRLTYHTAHSGEVAERVVEPYRMHNYMGSWHLVGFCRYRGEARIFLLGRIREIEPLDETFKHRQFDVAAFLEDSFGIFKGDNIRRASLRFSPEMSRMIRDEIWHRDQEIIENEDGGVTLSIPVSNLTEIRMKTLKYGSQVEALEPTELREQVLEEAKRIVKIYEKK